MQLGLAKQSFTPVGRGFNTSLGYLGGAEEHYHHTAGGGVDLWASDRSAVGYDGIYSANLYADHAANLIASHPKDRGLFMYVAFRSRTSQLKRRTSMLTSTQKRFRTVVASTTEWQVQSTMLSRTLQQRCTQVVSGSRRLSSGRQTMVAHLLSQDRAVQTTTP